MKTNKLSFIILLLLISFASVNAVLFTPALPIIAKFFVISDSAAQLTISWFLIGYALGQLLYGPLANRFGRKPALYIGIALQIASSLLCAFSGFFHHYFILVIGRFLLALGSGVGLKMTFTLVNESFEPKIASQKISYLMLAFAVTPGIAVALGGFLTTHYGWGSCFYIGAIYGFLLLFLSMKLPETCKKLDDHALEITHLWQAYSTQFKNKELISGGFIMGTCTAFIYIFAAASPFIAMNLAGMSSQSYGLANLLPPIGLFIGSLLSAYFVKRYSLIKLIKLGIILTLLFVICMFILCKLKFNIIISLFFPMIFIYFSLSFILANASSIAMSHAEDKAHGSAVMNFINMGYATTLVLMLGFFPIKLIFLSSIYLILSIFMWGIYKFSFELRATQTTMS
jgi:DHA1 family bicyclomycin/chloramphenicol resistance-like MFS transporter